MASSDELDGEQSAALSNGTSDQTTEETEVRRAGGRPKGSKDTVKRKRRLSVKVPSSVGPVGEVLTERQSEVLRARLNQLHLAAVYSLGAVARRCLEAKEPIPAQYVASILALLKHNDVKMANTSARAMSDALDSLTRNLAGDTQPFFIPRESLGSRHEDGNS